MGGLQVVNERKGIVQQVSQYDSFMIGQISRERHTCDIVSPCILT